MIKALIIAILLNSPCPSDTWTVRYDKQTNRFFIKNDKVAYDDLSEKEMLVIIRGL
jgi:hypothetical protein